MSQTLVHDFTKGPLFRPLLNFAVPFMASNAMQVLYSLVDMMVVGHYAGRPGLAAVALSSQLFMFMVALCMGMCQGGQVYLSQLIGSRQRQRLGSAIGTLFTMLMAAGAVMTLVGLCFSNQILHWMNTPQESFRDARAYMLICSGGVLFSYGYNITSSIFRGLGDSRHPFLFILVASILNLVLDLLFIARFQWGVAGAALATIIGQAVSFFCAILFLYRRRAETGFDFRWRSFRPDWRSVKGLLWLGLPMASRFGIINVSMLFVYSMVARAGTLELSTFGTGIRLDDTANKVCQGVMMALTGVVAQNYGARRFDRVRRAVWHCLTISVGFFAVFGAMLWFYPEFLFSLFTSDEAVLALSHTFVRAIIWTLPGLLLLKGTNGFVHGIGHSWLGLFFSLLDGCILRIGLSWLLGSYFQMGFFGYVLGYALSPWGSSLPGLLYFRYAPWEKRRLATE